MDRAGAYAFCVEHGLAECTVDAIAAALKANGIKVLSVLVSENNDLEPYAERMAALATGRRGGELPLRSRGGGLRFFDRRGLDDRRGRRVECGAAHVGPVEETATVETTVPVVLGRRRGL